MDEVTEKKMFEEVKSGFEHESSIYYSSARLWDDGVILPEDSRKV